MQPLQHLSCTHVYKHLSPSLAAQLGTTHAHLLGSVFPLSVYDAGTCRGVTTARKFGAELTSWPRRHE
jgi:hypothetical protein